MISRNLCRTDGVTTHTRHRWIMPEPIPALSTNGNPLLPQEEGRDAGIIRAESESFSLPATANTNRPEPRPSHRS